MILSRFFKPKWQHADPKVRREALAQLDSSDPTLVQLATADPDAGVRQTALERLSDPVLLRQRASDDSDPGVRSAAAERFQQLLTRADSGLSLAERQQLLASADHPDCLLHVLRHAPEPELRLAALARVQDPVVLQEVITQDPTLAVKTTALERIDDVAALETLAQQTRNRDKRVHRLVRERLDHYQAAAARRAKQERLVQEMTALADDPQVGPGDTRYRTLCRQWQDIPDPDADLAASFAAAQAQVAERNPEATRRPSSRESHSHLVGLLEALTTAEELNADLNAQIQAMEADPDLATNPTTADDVQAIRQRHRVLQRNHDRKQRLQKILHRANQRLEQSKPLRSSDIDRLEKEWRALEQPENPDLTARLQTEYNDLHNRFQQRLAQQAAQRDTVLERLKTLVAELSTALESGEINQATTLHDEARQLLRDHDFPPRDRREPEQTLQQLAGVLGELRDWRRWGSHQARDHLIEGAESLVDSDDPPPLRAKKVQTLRTDWQRLDRNEGAAGKALWERFNAACEKAYAPAQAHFEAQAQERRDNLMRKEVLCAELEALLADTDWETVSDWRAMDKRIGEGLASYHKLGPVNRSDRKTIDRRYRAIQKQLNNLLDRHRKIDLARREGLIHEVEALVDEPDLRTAIDGAKQAQARWQPQILAPRRQEQELWKRFRAACDAIFARRSAEQEAVDAERQDNLVAKQGLITEIDALTADSDSLNRSRSRVTEIRKQWADIGPVPQADYRRIDQQLQDALERFEQRVAAEQRNQQQEILQSLWQRHRLCSDLEALLEAPDDRDIKAMVDDARQTWGTLPKVKANVAEPMRQRFQQLCQTLNNGDTDSLRQTLHDHEDRKRQLCLRLEILAGVETPAEDAQLRMAYQVERLSESLTARETDRPLPSQEVETIQEEWCLHGLLPVAVRENLEARLQTAIRTFQKSPPQ